MPAEATPLKAAEALGQIYRVFPDINADGATLLLALIWVETGRGKLVQYNAGNITASERYEGLAWRPPWYTNSDNLSPKLKRLHELMLKGKAPRAFRAYPSADQGFDDFATQLRNTFPEVLQAAETGDARFFVASLAVKYSKDYGDAHVKTFEALQREFAPLTGAQVHTEPNYHQTQPAPAPAKQQQRDTGISSFALFLLLAKYLV